MELRKVRETGNQAVQSKQTRIKKMSQSSAFKFKAKDKFSTQHVNTCWNGHVLTVSRLIVQKVEDGVIVRK